MKGSAVRIRASAFPDAATFFAVRAILCRGDWKRTAESVDSGVTGERGGPDDPHVRFWNEWNREWRFRGDLDEFMERQREIATSVAQDAGLRNARILDVGCGTGWLQTRSCPSGRRWAPTSRPRRSRTEDGDIPTCSFCVATFSNSTWKARFSWSSARTRCCPCPTTRPASLGSPRYRRQAIRSYS